MFESNKTIDVEKDIRELVVTILDVDSKGIDPLADFVKDLGMDSMMALELLASIEKKYRIVIPEDYLPQFVNLQVTVSLVQDLLEKKK